MQTQVHNILSIVLETKYIGVAIFHDSDLRDWYVKSIKGNTFSSKRSYLTRYLYNLIERRNPDILVIKKLHPAHSSSTLRKLNTSLQLIGRKKHLAILEYPITYVEHSLLSGKANKKLLTEEVSKIYPIINHDYERDKKNKSRYLTRMFEAIAMGIVCIQSLDKKQKNQIT
jgi:hypothetical protein